MAVVDAHGDFAGFGLLQAAQAPEGGEELVDEHFFGDADGEVVFAQALVDGGEFIGVFLDMIAADEDFGGEDAVFEGVHFGGVASGRGFGAGGFFGVGLVGGDLGWGG